MEAKVEAGKKEKGWEPSVLAILCRWCSYAGADLTGSSRISYPPNIRVLRVPCSGRVDPLFILRALRSGLDGVLISGCHPGDCHYIEGNYHARRRWMAFRELIREAGLDERRVTFSWISASENRKFAETAKSVVERIKALGPNRAFRDISPARPVPTGYF